MKKILLPLFVLFIFFNCSDPSDPPPKPSPETKEMVDINVTQPEMFDTMDTGSISVSPDVRVEKGTEVTITFIPASFENVDWSIVGWGGDLAGETDLSVTLTADSDLNVSIEVYHEVLQPVLALWSSIREAKDKATDNITSQTPVMEDGKMVSVVILSSYESPYGGSSDISKTVTFDENINTSTAYTEISFTNFKDETGVTVNSTSNYSSYIDFSNSLGDRESHDNGAFQIQTPHGTTVSVSIVNITLINEAYSSGAFNVNGSEFAANLFSFEF